MCGAVSGMEYVATGHDLVFIGNEFNNDLTFIVIARSLRFRHDETKHVCVKETAYCWSRIYKNRFLFSLSLFFLSGLATDFTSIKRNTRLSKAIFPTHDNGAPPPSPETA